jgi:hypothetical protein
MTLVQTPPPVETGVQMHPSFVGAGFTLQRNTWVEAYDMGTLYLVPVSQVVECINELGETQKHYKYDTEIVTIPQGYDSKRFSCKKAAELAGYKFSFRLQRYCNDSSDEFFGTETLLGAHQAMRIDYTKPEDDYIVGLEVEKEDYDLSRKGLAWKLLQETGWARERDGSLDTGGFELVSPLLPIPERQLLPELWRAH